MHHVHLRLDYCASEIARLKLNADVIAGVTRRLIRDSGIQPGMRVLDIGCGVGDVSMLLAETVGKLGRVVAFDREPRAIETAQLRAIEAGHEQIDFMVGSENELADGPPFDAAIDRCVLVHQPDPVAMIHRAANAVRPGGIIAFQEPALQLQALVRLLIRVHAHRSAFAFMSRSGVPCRSRMRPPRFRAKNFPTCARPPTARGSPIQANTRWEMLPSLQENAIGTSELDPFRSSILGPWSPL